MEKEFSFLEMFRYCVRKWIIILIAAIIGCGCFTFYSYMPKNNTDIVSYKGNATIASINTLYPEINNNIDKETYGNIILEYNQNLNRALTIMTAPGLKNKVYTTFKDVYQPDKQSQAIADAEREFMQALRVAKTEISVEVSFVSRDTTDTELQLVKRIVDTYLDEAIMAAQTDNPKLTPKNAIIKSDLIRSSDIIMPDGKVVDVTKSSGSLLDVAIGLLGGAFLGFVITIIIYFADRRIKSFSDIACISGGKLLGVVQNADNVSVCPKIDAVVSSKNIKKALIASCDAVGSSLASEYSRYCAGAGYKTLLIDFNGDGASNGQDGSSGFIDAITQNNIAVSDDGYSKISARKNEWVTLLNNLPQYESVCKTFDRVVVVCDYSQNGALAVVGQVCDGVVLAVDQSTSVRQDAYGLAYELDCNSKMIGAVIYNPTKSYVGERI